MAIRVQHTVNVFISDDTAGLCPLFGTQDTSKELKTLDAFDRCTTGKLNIAASGTEDLPFGDVDVPRGIYIDADRPFDVVFNGGVEVVEIRPAVAPSGTELGGRAKLFMEVDSLTQVEITNPDATYALNAKYAVWGDPTP